MFGRDLFRYNISRYYRNAHNIKKLAGQFWTIFYYLRKTDFLEKIPIFSIPAHDTGSKVRNSDPK